jgi:acetyl-CoA hydrolase
MLDFMESGKMLFGSAVGLALSKGGFDRMYKNFDFFRDRILLRPQHVANSPSIIRRLGVIALNSALEVDIYGHVNSTLVNGSRMMHGIGGSGDYLRNAGLSIVHLPSARKTATGWLSAIVPKVPHVDHTEHDIAIVVTEQGVADLRGLTPRQRARELIKISHPVFRDQLTAYLDMAETRCRLTESMHEPHMLDKAFKMHLNMRDKGTMVLDSW